MKNLIGIDIGGTKTSIIFATEELDILEKEKFETLSPNKTLNKIVNIITKFKEKYGDIYDIGISCGGPLSSANGTILCPPNLPKWKNIEIVKYLKSELNMNSSLENDANACAMAEYLWGAGKESHNMAFLTFGTGLGAGLILNKKLYRGSSDMAGEIGHIRLSDSGPIGYNKEGSFEGFCSGGGILRLCNIRIKEKENSKDVKEFLELTKNERLSTLIIANAAKSGNKFALSIFKESAIYLGKGLSILIDILNLDRIIIGGIYTRMEEYYKDICLEIIDKEALSYSAKSCKILPSFFKEEIGDYSALAVATNRL